MKKYLIPAILSVSLFISACGGEETTNTGTPSTDSTKTEEKPLEMPETIRYRDANAGFNFSYPSKIKVNGDKNTLGVSVKAVPVEMLDENEDGISIEDANASREAMPQGEFGVAETGAVAAEQYLQQIGDGENDWAQDFAVLTEGDPCEVIFERKLVFFKDGYRVAISVTGDKAALMAEFPDYFQTDDNNCGGGMVWKSEADQEKFYKYARTEAESGPAADWSDLYWDVMQSVEMK